MALPVPTRSVMEDRFESYVATDPPLLASAVRRELSEYDFVEAVEGTSHFHRLYAMKLVSVFTAQEFSSKIFIFSVHERFSKLEIKGFSRHRDEMKKMLAGIHSQLGGRIWDFSYRESLLVNLPNSAIALLFIVFPSLFFGGVSLQSLLVSFFLLQFILPTLTASLRKDTEKKWKPYTQPVSQLSRKIESEKERRFDGGFEEKGEGWPVEAYEKKGRKKEKGKKEEEDELAWGNVESDYKWEGVWD